MRRFVGGGAGRGLFKLGPCEVKTGVHYAVVFLCGSVLFVLEKGARKRDGVQQHSSRPARE